MLWHITTETIRIKNKRDFQSIPFFSGLLPITTFDRLRAQRKHPPVKLIAEKKKKNREGKNYLRRHCSPTFEIFGKTSQPSSSWDFFDNDTLIWKNFIDQNSEVLSSKNQIHGLKNERMNLDPNIKKISLPVFLTAKKLLSSIFIVDYH